MTSMISGFCTANLVTLDLRIRKKGREATNGSQPRPRRRAVFSSQPGRTLFGGQMQVPLRSEWKDSVYWQDFIFVYFWYFGFGSIEGLNWFLEMTEWLVYQWQNFWSKVVLKLGWDAGMAVVETCWDVCDSINSNCIVPLKIGSKARESQSLAAWEGTVYGFGYEDISLLTTLTLNLKTFLLQFIYLMFFNRQVQRIIDESYAGKKIRLLLPLHFFHFFSPGLSPTKSCRATLLRYRNRWATMLHCFSGLLRWLVRRCRRRSAKVTWDWYETRDTMKFFKSGKSLKSDC